MLADTPLIKNLDGRENLESLFAELGAMLRESSTESKTESDRLFTGFKAIIKIPTLPENIVRLITHATRLPGKFN